MPPAAHDTGKKSKYGALRPRVDVIPLLRRNTPRGMARVPAASGRAYCVRRLRAVYLRDEQNAPPDNAA